MSGIEHLDFDSAFEFLSSRYPELASQDKLARAIGCQKSNISMRRKEGRFLVEWVDKINKNEDLNLNIDKDKLIANAKPFVDKGTNFSKSKASKNYWFYDWHPVKANDPDNPMGKFEKHYFSDLVAVNMSFLARKEAKPENTFLFKDVYGTMAPRIMATDVLLVEVCSEFKKKGLYVIEEDNKLKLYEIDEYDDKSYMMTQLTPKESLRIQKKALELDVVGKVLLRVTEEF